MTVADLNTNWLPGEPGIANAINQHAALLTDLDELTTAGRLSESGLDAKTDEAVASKTEGAGLTLWKRSPARTLTFYDADASGAVDASAAWASAMADIPAGGTLSIPEGKFLLPSVDVTRPDVHVEGPGTVKGRVTYGALGGNTDFLGRSLVGVRFDREQPSTAPTDACVRLHNPLNLRIHDCTFRNAGAAIYTLTEYDNARNIISNNHYHNVGFFFRSITGAAPAGRSAAMQWRSLADIHFIDNSGQSNVTAIHIDSIDGALIQGNTFFSPGFDKQSTVKERNVRIGYSDWLVITGNNFFEAGLESVLLIDPNHFTVTDNNIAWPGQRTPSDAINVQFAQRTFAIGSVGGGTISQATKNVIGFSGSGAIDLRFITIQPMSIERSISTPPDQYYGTDPLPTPYRVYVPTEITSQMPALPPAAQHGFGVNLPDYHRGRVITEERYLAGSVKEQTMGFRTTTITSAQRLYVLRSADGAGSTHFGGTITLYMTNDGATAKAAMYQLMVVKSPDGTIGCVTLAATGRTGGSAANDPSFTFDIELDSGTYYLRATKIGSTSGAFGYIGWATGPIHLG